jgi:DNA-binding phage protein
VTPLQPPEHLDALRLVEQTKDAAEDARHAAEEAERAHHEAILAAVALPGMTKSAIARAAGISRTRIYKRLNQPVYGDRRASTTA